MILQLPQFLQIRKRFYVGGVVVVVGVSPDISDNLFAAAVRKWRRRWRRYWQLPEAQAAI